MATREEQFAQLAEMAKERSETKKVDGAQVLMVDWQWVCSSVLAIVDELAKIGLSEVAHSGDPDLAKVTSLSYGIQSVQYAFESLETVFLAAHSENVAEIVAGASDFDGELRRMMDGGY